MRQPLTPRNDGTQTSASHTPTAVDVQSLRNGTELRAFATNFEGDVTTAPRLLTCSSDDHDTVAQLRSLQVEYSQIKRDGDRFSQHMEDWMCRQEALVKQVSSQAQNFANPMCSRFQESVCSRKMPDVQADEVLLDASLKWNAGMQTPIIFERDKESPTRAMAELTDSGCFTAPPDSLSRDALEDKSVNFTAHPSYQRRFSEQNASTGSESVRSMKERIKSSFGEALGEHELTNAVAIRSTRLNPDSEGTRASNGSWRAHARYLESKTLNSTMTKFKGHWYTCDFCMRAVESSYFDMGTCLIITLSSIINGVEVQMLATSKATAEKWPFKELQVVFCVIFTIELVMRLSAYHLDFFTNEDWHWNVFDFLLVALSLFEAYFILSGGDQVISPSSQRVLRAVRVIRNLRVIRMLRFFYELRRLLRAVFGSFKTLVWLGILLGILLYFFAVCFVSGVTNHLDSLNGQLCEGINCQYNKILQDEYGDIWLSVISLFKAITGGVNWGPASEALEYAGTWLKVCYLGYILFTVFAFMNAVTSVFVDNAMQAASYEKEQLIAQELKSKDSMLKELDNLFQETDTDNSGSLTPDEFVTSLKDPKAMAYLRILGVDTDDLHGLFELVDQDENGHIDIHEFLREIPRLSGAAASLDVARVHVDTKKVLRRFMRFAEWMSFEFISLKKAVASLNQDAMAPAVKCNSPKSPKGRATLSFPESAVPVESSPPRLRSAIQCLPAAEMDCTGQTRSTPSIHGVHPRVQSAPARASSCGGVECASPFRVLPW